MNKVRILATGGTIEKAYNISSEEFAFIGNNSLQTLATDCFRKNILIERVMQEDSLDMGDRHRTQILEAIDSFEDDRYLIVHGTSTMTETADFLIEAEGVSSTKTIVLTGSLYPSEMRHPETSFNVGLAYSAALLKPPGVYIAMHGLVEEAGRVVKNLSTGAFEKLR